MATIEKNWTNYESELSNVDQRKWPSIKMSSTLETLNSIDSAYSKESFYKTNGEKVEYDMDSVKAYLKKLADTANYWEFVKEVNRWNWWLMNLAVQIALESLNYDVGKIDWLMWPKTRGKVIEFQRANGLSPDGVVWPKTAKKLLEVLWWEPTTVEETDKEKIEKVEANDKEVKKWEEVKAEDLVKNLPEGWTAEFKDGKGIDTSKEWDTEVIVIVKVWAEVKEIVVKVKVVVEVVVEETAETIEKYYDFWKENCRYIGEYYPNKILTITNREDLKQFGDNLYNRFDDSYFVDHNLSIRYSYISSTVDKWYYIDNVSR